MAVSYITSSVASVGAAVSMPGSANQYVGKLGIILGAWFYSDEGSSATLSGWTSIAQVGGRNPAQTKIAGIQMWWRIIQTGDTSFNFTPPGSGGDRMTSLLLFDGADTSSPIQLLPATNYISDTGSPSVDGQTVAANGSMSVVGTTTWDGDEQFNPSGYTQRTQAGVGESTTLTRAVNIGATGTLTGTFGSADIFAGIHFIIKPSSAASPLDLGQLVATPVAPTTVVQVLATLVPSAVASSAATLVLPVFTPTVVAPSAAVSIIDLAQLSPTPVAPSAAALVEAPLVETPVAASAAAAVLATLTPTPVAPSIAAHVIELAQLTPTPVAPSIAPTVLQPLSALAVNNSTASTVLKALTPTPVQPSTAPNTKLYKILIIGNSRLDGTLNGGFTSNYGLIMSLGLAPLLPYAEIVSVPPYDGVTTSQLLADYATDVAPLFEPGRRNIIIFGEDVNEIYYNGSTGAQNYDLVEDYANAAHADGFEFLVITPPPVEDGIQSQLNAYSALVRASSVIDWVIDAATYAGFYPPGVTPPDANPLYSDDTHLSDGANGGYDIFRRLVADAFIQYIAIHLGQLSPTAVAPSAVGLVLRDLTPTATAASVATAFLGQLSPTPVGASASGMRLDALVPTEVAPSAASVVLSTLSPTSVEASAVPIQLAALSPTAVGASTASAVLGQLVPTAVGASGAGMQLDALSPTSVAPSSASAVLETLNALPVAFSHAALVLRELTPTPVDPASAGGVVVLGQLSPTPVAPSTAGLALAPLVPTPVAPGVLPLSLTGFTATAIAPSTAGLQLSQLTPSPAAASVAALRLATFTPTPVGGSSIVVGLGTLVPTPVAPSAASLALGQLTPTPVDPSSIGGILDLGQLSPTPVAPSAATTVLGQLTPTPVGASGSGLRLVVLNATSVAPSQAVLVFPHLLPTPVDPSEAIDIGLVLGQLTPTPVAPSAASVVLAQLIPFPVQPSSTRSAEDPEELEHLREAAAQLDGPSFSPRGSARGSRLNIKISRG